MYFTAAASASHRIEVHAWNKLDPVFYCSWNEDRNQMFIVMEPSSPYIQLYDSRRTQCCQGTDLLVVLQEVTQAVIEDMRKVVKTLTIEEDTGLVPQQGRYSQQLATDSKAQLWKKLSDTYQTLSHPSLQYSIGKIHCNISFCFWACSHIDTLLQ